MLDFCTASSISHTLTWLGKCVFPILRKMVGPALGSNFRVLITKLEIEAMLMSENYHLIAPPFLESGEENRKEKRCFTAGSDILGDLGSFFLKNY